jgi:hypothetical protein
MLFSIAAVLVIMGGSLGWWFTKSPTQPANKTAVVAATPLTTQSTQTETSPLVAVPPAPTAPSSKVAATTSEAAPLVVENQISTDDQEKKKRALQDAKRKLRIDALKKRREELLAKNKADEEARRTAELANARDREVRARQAEANRQPKGVVARSTPQQVCADRPNFISRGICESRECDKPERAGVQFCIDMHERRSRRDSN